MTIEHTGSLSEWLRKTISKLKSHLAELGYSESTILRLDATWKELIVYCEAYQATEFTVDLERRFVWERYSADLGDTARSVGWSTAEQRKERLLRRRNTCKQPIPQPRAFLPAMCAVCGRFTQPTRNPPKPCAWRCTSAGRRMWRF